MLFIIILILFVIKLLNFKIFILIFSSFSCILMLYLLPTFLFFYNKIYQKFPKGLSILKTSMGKLYGCLTILRLWEWGFPGGAVVKNPPANAGDTG